jgi:hypothetical protein
VVSSLFLGLSRGSPRHDRLCAKFVEDEFLKCDRLAELWVKYTVGQRGGEGTDCPTVSFVNSLTLTIYNAPQRKLLLPFHTRETSETRFDPISPASFPTILTPFHPYDAYSTLVHGAREGRGPAAGADRGGGCVQVESSRHIA